MSLPRLPFLYPALFRGPKSWEAYASLCSLPGPRQPHSARLFNTTFTRRQESTYTQRYGPAAEPIPPPTQEQKDAIDKRLPSLDKTKEGSAEDQQKKTGIGTLMDKKDGNEENADVALAGKDPKLAADEAHPAQPPTHQTLESAQQSIPDQLEKVLHMEAPTAMKADSDKDKPHLQPAPYVHHFDTYTLVKDLSNGGFTSEQSVTIMKAIRGMLSENLDMAKAGLVSKSDVENETYLFRAACSELKTEIMNSRKRAAENMRSDRAHLQHDVDILSQKVTQEAGALKDDLKGMFDDRKMETRMEQRSMESKIQELNYKITVNLVGDSKGEVEGLRWFLTRRAAMFIGSMALLILGYLRYSTYVNHQQQEEKKKFASGTSPGSGSRIDTALASAGGATDAVLASMDESKGENVSYVSLG